MRAGVPRRNQGKTALLMCLLWSLSSFAWAVCPSHLCNLATDGAYDKLISGELVHVATDDELKQVYHWAKSHGRWAALPSAFPLYLQGTKLVSIKSPDSKEPISVFMAREEYDAAPLIVGDLVRYKPHDPNWEAPKDPEQKRIFYGLTGCVATLCSAGSGTCKSRYRQGFFTTTGVQIDGAQGKSMAKGARIDPLSLLPLSPAH